MENSGSIQREMPKYQSRKQVHALKILKIVLDEEATGMGTLSGAVITPVDEGYAPFAVDSAYMNKHRPVAGGYYVVYEDGYKSFSPADAFEKGNKPFTGDTIIGRLIAEETELNDKKTKLATFIASSSFQNIDKEQQSFMKIQFNAMETYSECLNQRLIHMSNK